MSRQAQEPTGPVSPAPRRIAVIGGGISGLAAAHRLTVIAPQASITLFESSDRLGGILQTTRRDGFLVERSADSFITNVPWAVDLCRRIGLGDQLLATNPDDRRVFVVRKARLREVPAGFTLMAPARLRPILTTPILSPLGKLRLAWEYFLPARPAMDDESLASFVRRRLGREAFERLVQPLIGGIYTADPEQLSLRATMPRFLEMERKHGGLIRGARRERNNDVAAEGTASGARYSLFLAPRDGMASLVEAIAQRLPQDCTRLNASVEGLSRGSSGGWDVRLTGQRSESVSESFDAVILAVPCSAASRLLREASADLAAELAGISYASSAVVCAAYSKDQFPQPLRGFGFVVPHIERRSIFSVSYASAKFPGRAPDDKVLLRVFFGGALQPEMAVESDAVLQDLTQRELHDLLGLRGDALWSEVARWPQTMPQYTIGHVDRVQRIAALVDSLPGLALAGNAFYGVGLPQCIRSGEQAAEAVCGFTVESERPKAAPTRN